MSLLTCKHILERAGDVRFSCPLCQICHSVCQNSDIHRRKLAWHKNSFPNREENWSPLVQVGERLCLKAVKWPSGGVAIQHVFLYLCTHSQVSQYAFTVRTHTPEHSSFQCNSHPLGKSGSFTKTFIAVVFPKQPLTVHFRRPITILCSCT